MSIKTDVCGPFPQCLSLPFQPMYSQYSSKEVFVYFVCPTEIPQPPFAWKYYLLVCKHNYKTSMYCPMSEIKHTHTKPWMS